MEFLTIKEIVNAVGGVLLSGQDDWVVSSVSINSKEIEEKAIFIPIIGEKVDAHNYIQDALDNGAIATFTSKKELLYDFTKAYIFVEDTLNALQILSSYYRDKFQIPIIGITGSVGKTTTKEMITKALEVKYKVLKTIGNMNSQVGLPLMMFHLQKEYDIAVIEMGMSERGEMERLCNIAKPSMSVITNIGVSHIANLGSKENIMTEKLNIINKLDDKGTLFLNGDDSLLSSLDNDIAPTIITFGLDAHNIYRAIDIKTVGKSTVFTLLYQDIVEEVIIPVLGIHNVYNALVAIAIANCYNISPMESKEGLLDYAPIAMRGQIKEKNEIKVIDDTYNASPDSVKGAIRVLLELPNVKRRIAVLADILELGEMSLKYHYELGEFISKLEIDQVVTIGENVKQITNAVKANNTLIKVINFSANKEAIDYLTDILAKGDGVLIKGSRGMHTDEIVKAILSDE